LKFVIFEIGNNKQDTQHRQTDFNWTLEDYKLHIEEEIKENKDLVLIDSRFTDGGNSIVIDYFSKHMGKNGKSVRLYVLSIDGEKEETD